MQGRHFRQTKSPCGNAPQHRTGLVKLTISLLFGTIGDYLIVIGDYSRLIGIYLVLIGDYLVVVGDYLGLIVINS
jgi:hypothetical protein